MKRELKYFLTIIFTFTASLSFLLLLIKKYSFSSLDQFVEVCRRVSTNLLDSVTHHVGFGLSALVTISVIILLVKTIFSYIKTSKKIQSLLKQRSKIYPSGVLKILSQNNIQEDKLIIVKSKKDVALTINWINTRFVLSTGLIEKLSTRELESVILHESYHAKNKHPLILVVSEIITSSLFFIPLLKDINNKLKSVLENEADNFVNFVQGNSTSLDLALSRVNVNNPFLVYPSFSRREKHKINIKNVLTTTLVVLAGITLYFRPIQTHAYTNISEIDSNCNDQQCSVHCLSDGESSEVFMPTRYQSKIIMSSYR